MRGLLRSGRYRTVQYQVMLAVPKPTFEQRKRALLAKVVTAVKNLELLHAVEAD